MDASAANSSVVLLWSSERRACPAGTTTLTLRQPHGSRSGAASAFLADCITSLAAATATRMEEASGANGFWTARTEPQPGGDGGGELQQRGPASVFSVLGFRYVWDTAAAGGGTGAHNGSGLIWPDREGVLPAGWGREDGFEALLRPQVRARVVERSVVAVTSPYV